MSTLAALLMLIGQAVELAAIAATFVKAAILETLGHSPAVSATVIGASLAAFC